jgi:hypothetical protein
MGLACRICIATGGLQGSEISSLLQNEEELIEHMEKVHHMPVIMPGETKQQATDRFLKKYPGAKNCPVCQGRRAPWAKK